MTATQFSDAMGFLSDRYIEEADSYQVNKHRLPGWLIRAAGLGVLFTILLSAYWISDASARDGLFSWLKNDKGSEVIYQNPAGAIVIGTETIAGATGNSENSVAYTDYTLGYIPEGLTLIEEATEPDGFMQLYLSDDGMITLFQYLSGENGFLTIYPEACDPVQTSVGTNPAEIYRLESEYNSSVIIWTDLETGMLLAISGPYDAETLVKMAESVTAVANPPA